MAFKVQGNVTLSSVGVARRLRFYRTDTGALLVEDASAGDGTYDVDVGYSGSVTVTVDRDYGEAWQAILSYPPEAIVIPTSPNGHWYKLTSGSGTAESWSTSASLKSADLSLTNSNKTITYDSGTGAKSARNVTLAVPANTASKVYFEVILSTSGGSGTKGVGIANATINNVNNRFTASGTAAYLSTGSKNINSGSDTAFGSSWTAGDVIGVAYDSATRKVWFSKNDVWQASGDPAAGTNEAGILNDTGDPDRYIGIFLGSAGDVATLRTISADFTGTIPSGFSAYGAGGLTGATEPTWPTGGGSVVDNDVTWTDQGDMERPLSHGPIIPVVV